MNKKSKYANILEQMLQQKAFLPTYAPNLEEQMVQQNATLWMKFGEAKITIQVLSMLIMPMVDWWYDIYPLCKPGISLALTGY